MWAPAAHHPLDTLKAEPSPHTCHPCAWIGATLIESLASWCLPLSMYRPHELGLELLGTGVEWGFHTHSAPIHADPHPAGTHELSAGGGVQSPPTCWPHLQWG